MDARFDQAREVADAVLHEGYMLYPYRASALKNRFRWQFGNVVPRAYNDAHDSEPWWIQTECVIEATAAATVTIHVRYLQLQRRTIEEAVGEHGVAWRPAERLTIDGNELFAWDEGVVRTVTQDPLRLQDLSTARSFEYKLPGGEDFVVVRGVDGAARARIVRERQPLRFMLRVAAQQCDRLVKLTVRLENTGDVMPNACADRAMALRHSLVSCHALLGVHEGAFVSMIDPPEYAAAAVRTCANHHLWPVLAGCHGTRDVMLAAPIVLYDHPAVARESRGDFFDATEIDELLTLRVLTMTDAEKSEAAATDERSRRILERVERAPPRDVLRLHGAIRSDSQLPQLTDALASWETLLNPPNEPSPENASVVIQGAILSRGSRVRLLPHRQVDSMDMFLRGRTAIVAAVQRDLEDRTFIAVTLEDDPAADFQHEVGRYLHFMPDELEPLSEGQGHGGHG